MKEAFYYLSKSPNKFQASREPVEAVETKSFKDMPYTKSLPKYEYNAPEFVRIMENQSKPTIFTLLDYKKTRAELAGES